MKLKIENSMKVKFLFLVIAYLLFFYFLIIKNIFIFLELKEYKSSEEIAIQRLSIENEELKNSISARKKELEYKVSFLENLKLSKDDKVDFESLSKAFEEINSLMNKNNILFESFSRLQKYDNIYKTSLSFSADEKDLINFIKGLENSGYYFNLSSSYLKIYSSDKNLSAKIPILFKINNKFKKTAFESQNSIINKNIFVKNRTSSKLQSYIRIGNNKFYRANNLNANIQENQDPSSTVVDNKK